MAGSKKTTKRGSTDWFTEARFGMFIHWGLYALPARHEWVKNVEELTDEAYQPYFDRFDPDLFDPAAWARAARRAGMRYVVITAKHHEGFCLWDSKHTDYKATNTPGGRDLLREALDAFRAEGLRIGLYYSLIDWHHPEFPVDRLHPRRNDDDYRAANQGRDVTKYAAYMRDQVSELLTDYGDIDIIWFDFSYPGEDGKGHADWASDQLLKLVRTLRPGILVNDRLDLPGSADLVTPEQVVPPEGLRDVAGDPIVWEGCQTFSGSWGYHRDEATWKSIPMLVHMLIEHVSKGGNLLLNVGPTARGEFDARATERLEGMGVWMRHHGRAIYGCQAAPAEYPVSPDFRYTFNPDSRRLYVHLFAWPFKVLRLPRLGGKVAYAQLLHDASEVHYRVGEKEEAGTLLLELPVVKPDVEVPVIELFLG